MSFNFRICRNDTTTLLRKHFNATPMRVPDASVQPLLVVAEKHGRTDKRGQLKHLLQGAGEIVLPVHDDTVADVAITQTRSMSWDIGAKLLDGFLQGFQLPGASVAAALSNAREVSLSFGNVRRRWVDKNELGSAIRDRVLDLGHPAAGIFFGEDAHNMLLVTDIIVSNGIAIRFEKTADGTVEAKVPLLQEIASDAHAKVEIKKKGGNSIVFEGEDFLTFAFTCIQLKVDPDSGQLGIGITVIAQEAKAGESPQDVGTPMPVELDDDLYEPGMLEWDD